MLVYRLEDTTGGGAYNGPNAPNIDDVFEATAAYEGNYSFRHHLDLRPAPPADIPGWGTDTWGTSKGHKGYKFGFQSLRALHSWFPPPALDLYRNRPYAIAVYEVPEKSAWFGKRQVAYKTADAKLVKRISLDDVNGS